jgi:hypothetical protein
VSPVWLVPCTLAVIAALALIASARAVRSEAALLSEDLVGLAHLRDRARALQAESERTAHAADLASEALAPRAPQ